MSKSSIAITLFITATFCIGVVEAWFWETQRTPEMAGTPANSCTTSDFPNQPLFCEMLDHVRLLPAMNDTVTKTNEIVSDAETVLKLMHGLVMPNGTFDAEHAYNKFVKPLVPKVLQQVKKLLGVNDPSETTNRPKWVTIISVVLFIVLRIRSMCRSGVSSKITVGMAVVKGLCMCVASEFAFYAMSWVVWGMLYLLAIPSWFSDSAKNLQLWFADSNDIICSTMALGGILFVLFVPHVLASVGRTICIELFGLVPNTPTVPSSSNDTPKITTTTSGSAGAPSPRAEPVVEAAKPSADVVGTAAPSPRRWPWTFCGVRPSTLKAEVQAADAKIVSNSNVDKPEDADREFERFPDEPLAVYSDRISALMTAKSQKRGGVTAK